MLGFLIVNLLIPDEPDTLKISTSSGDWHFKKWTRYAQSRDAIRSGRCAHTYVIENSISIDDGAAACETALDEMTPLLLGASYLSALSVTVKSSLPSSDITIIQPSGHWPRERALGDGNHCVSTQMEFVDAIAGFVAAWPAKAQSEKLLILIHHWLDALGCWSFEDFYLSATTLLQIIAATEKRFQGNKRLKYLPAVRSASRRVGIASLSRDFKDMRNNLIHEGRLLGGRFAGKDKQACSTVAADLLNWFDEYVHAVMNLGPVKRRRYSAHDFMFLNAYSI